jgi:hypothetical protein
VSAAASPENPHAGQGAVVLDIGGDVGALIVSTPAHLAGVEIEICPAGARGRVPDEGAGWWAGTWRAHHHDQASDHEHGPAWPHVGVLRRALGGVDQCAAVFPGLRAGRYDLWIKPDHSTALTASVVGGQVSTVQWPLPLSRVR